MKTAICASAILWLFLGCSDAAGPDPSGAVPAGLAGLADALRAGPLPAEKLRDPALPGALSALLASEPDTGLVIAALRELPRCWGEAPDVDCLVPLLASADERVLAAALAAARAARQRAASDPGLEGALRSLTRDSRPAVRLAAYEALWLGLGARSTAESGRLFGDALHDPEVAVIAAVLQGISGRAYALDQGEPVADACWDLLGHADPGLRGGAAEVLSQLVVAGAERDALGQRLEALLADADPYVVSQAATGLGRLRRVAALPALMALLDDRRANTCMLPAAPRLSGSSDSLILRGSAWQRVDDAVLRAIERVSSEVAGDPFVYGTVRAERVDADIARQVAQARLWYEDAAELLDQP